MHAYLWWIWLNWIYILILIHILSSESANITCWKFLTTQNIQNHSFNNELHNEKDITFFIQECFANCLLRKEEIQHCIILFQNAAIIVDFSAVVSFLNFCYTIIWTLIWTMIMWSNVLTKLVHIAKYSQTGLLHWTGNWTFSKPYRFSDFF